MSIPRHGVQGSGTCLEKGQCYSSVTSSGGADEDRNDLYETGPVGEAGTPLRSPTGQGQGAPKTTPGAGLLTSPCRCRPEPGRKSAKCVWVGAAGGGGSRGCGVLGGQPRDHHSQVQDRDPGTPPFNSQDSSEETHCVQRLTDAPTHGRRSASNRPHNPCDCLARGLGAGRVLLQGLRNAPGLSGDKEGCGPRVGRQRVPAKAQGSPWKRCHRRPGASTSEGNTTQAGAW